MNNCDPLRNQIRDTVLTRIVDGSLAPGARVSLALLASELHVSPTPAREALTQLEHEGFLVSEPNRGFFVAPLMLREAQDIYPIIWTLEALAVNLQGSLSEEQVQVLQRANNALADASDIPEEAIHLDQHWHEMLIQHCPNKLVKAEIASMKRRALRYELAYMRDSNKISFSMTQHKEILEALMENQMAHVAQVLERHWRMSLDFLELWLREKSRVYL